jgi:Protein of unknown function (DUF2637)
VKLKKLADGIAFQALMVGSLSFSHIHDVVAAHGQAGWKSWLYPPSVDLLTVAAFRKLVAARRDGEPTGSAWCAFLLGLAVSLAANVIDSWNYPSGRVLAVAIGVWPAVALFACTLLAHDPTPAVEQTDAPASPVSASAPVPTPAVVEKPDQAAPAVPDSVAPADELPAIAPPLLAWARGIADQHRATTGAPITPDALATRLNVAPALAHAVHTHLTSGTAGA